MTDPNIKLGRLYLMAKSAFKHKIHIPEAMAIFRRVVRARDMPAGRKDYALRTLAKFERHGQRKKPENPLARYGPPPYWPRTWVGELMHNQYGGTLLPEGVVCDKNTPPEHRQWPGDLTELRDGPRLVEEDRDE